MEILTETVARREARFLTLWGTRGTHDHTMNGHSWSKKRLKQETTSASSRLRGWNGSGNFGGDHRGDFGENDSFSHGGYFAKVALVTDIVAELFKILKGGAIKILHSICQQIWKTHQWPQDWKRSIFIPIPKKGDTKEFSNYCTIALISHASKVMLKILHAKLQRYMIWELLNV